MHDADTRLDNANYNHEIDNEVELLKLERSMARINRFSRRELENSPEDHERKEKRMLNRAIVRKVHQVKHELYSESELQ